MYDAADTFQDTGIWILDSVRRGSEAESHRSRETPNGSLLIQEPKPSNNQFTMQLEELKQFDVDIFIDYYSPRDQRVVSERERWNPASTVLDLDPRRFELSPLQQCCDISPGTLRLRFLLLLKRS